MEIIKNQKVTDRIRCPKCKSRKLTLCCSSKEPYYHRCEKCGVKFYTRTAKVDYMIFEKGELISKKLFEKGEWE